MRQSSVCLPPRDKWVNQTYGYVDVTLRGCQTLCTGVHTHVCSLLLYDVIDRVSVHTKCETLTQYWLMLYPDRGGPTEASIRSILFII